MKKNTKLIIGVTVAIIIILFGWYYYKEATTTGPYDELAQCLVDKDVKFYGAFWCHNCESQKDLFGRSERLLPYIECSSADGQRQLQACIDAGIEGYPTWEYSDGSRDVGTRTLEELAEKAGCELPV